MQNDWHESSRQVVLADGAMAFVGFLCSTEQVRRWSAAGYRIRDAAERERAFAPTFDAAPDVETAWALLAGHFAQELTLALAAGVDPEDPDLWRIERSARGWIWDPD